MMITRNRFECVAPSKKLLENPHRMTSERQHAAFGKGSDFRGDCQSSILHLFFDILAIFYTEFVQCKIYSVERYQIRFEVNQRFS